MVTTNSEALVRANGHEYVEIPAAVVNGIITFTGPKK
jgi:hypothetical protein